MTQSLDILAFAPHPDDAELGCGGSLILAAQQGLKVAVADMSAGEKSSRGTPNQRRQETEQATRILGLTARFSLDLPDTQIGTDVAHRDPVIQLIRETRPHLVLAPYWEDRHPDHAAAGNLIRQACFLAGAGKVGTDTPHRPQQLYHYMIHQPFTPSFVIDVSPVWALKMTAIEAYASQFGSSGPGVSTAISQPAFKQVIEAKAIWLGAMIGATYGEAFYAPGPVPLRQFPGLNVAPPDALPPYKIY